MPSIYHTSLMQPNSTAPSATSPSYFVRPIHPSNHTIRPILLPAAPPLTGTFYSIHVLAAASQPRRVLAAAVPNSAPSGAAPPRPPPPSPAPRRVLASTRRPPLRAVDSDTATVTSAVPAPTQRPRVHARRTAAALACTLLLSSPEKLDVPPLDATADLAGEGRCSPLVYPSSTRSPVPPIPLPCRPPELHLRLFSYFV